MKNMIKKKTYSLLIIVLIISAQLFSQSTTYQPDKSKEEENSNKYAKKVLIIPFEQKMYLSEIDRYINKETKMSFPEIRHTFLAGIDFQLLLAFKKNFNAYSMMADTATTGKDQQLVYASTGYSYDVVPNSENDKNKKNQDGKAKIQNGQLMVTTSDQKKFMNLKLNNKNVLATLNKKYKADLFIFVNELDLKHNGGDMMQSVALGVNDRIAAVHYTIYDVNGTIVNAGLSTQTFPSDINEPKKIINNYFSLIANDILASYMKTLAKPDEKKEGGLLKNKK